MPDSTVTIVGNLTRDPELRYTNSGLATVRVGVAVNRRRQNAAGEWEENTSFFDVICWRDMAENVAGSLAKGTRVIVTGRLEQRQYENREGNKVNVVEIIADEVGPSLRWATAEVVKPERDGGGGGGGGFNRGGGNSDPGPAPSYQSDEEPF